MKEILSEKAACYAARKYQMNLPSLKGRAEAVSSAVDKLVGNEKVLMEFMYGTMPLCDAADYEPELFYSYVKHGLFLREMCQWTRELPEELFLNYVLCHRVNNEAITDCRGWFYDMLHPLLEGRRLEEAVREVNYWCAAQASYAASDERTLSPAAVFLSGSGRCGEESTFLVTALRSVGIAARQVYAPRWAHCDDNHAWVEAWVNGGWHFLGACEPEEVLDKGWFTNASSRAMLVHTRVFSDYFGIDQEKPEVTERDGAAYLLNITDTYAKTSKLTVLVKDECKNPLPDVKVSFELLNAAEYKAIAVLATDGEGRVSLTLGLGSIRLHVSRGSRQRELLVENGQVKEVSVVLSKELWQQEPENQKREWQYADYRAPEDFPVHPVTLTKEQKERGRKRKQEAERSRKEKLERFAEQAGRFIEELPEKQDDLSRGILKAARGNCPEIMRFLKRYPEKEALRFLSVLTEKDYRDIRAELLEEHYRYGQEVREFTYQEYLEGELHPGELFLRYVWNPRIGYEEITSYRSFLDDVLTKEQKMIFRREPERIWEWIQETVDLAGKENRGYSPVITSPAGVMRVGQGSIPEQKTLFVAICRTLGIPARLHPATRAAEYYREHSFHSAVCTKEEKRKVRLILTSERKPEYSASWTIGRLIREPEGAHGKFYERFETLDYTGKEFKENTLTLELPEGVYRLITTVRLPDGNQLEARRIVDSGDFMPGEDGIPQCSLALDFRRPELSQMLEELKLESFSLRREDGARVEDREVMGECHTLLAFLEEGAEPTEHLLNELKERAQEVRASGFKVVFVVAGKDALKHPALADAVRLLEARVYYDDFQELPELLARRMYTDPEKLPLVLLVSPGRIGRYAGSGYNVGSVGLMLEIAGMVNGGGKN